MPVAGASLAVAPAERQLLAFEGLPFAVLFVDAREVIDTARAVLRGWSLVDADPGRQPDIVVSNTPEGFVVGLVDLEILSDPLSSVSAVCFLLVELVTMMVDRDPGWLCLHAAALEHDGRLLVLAGEARAGKSTLAVALAAAGLTLYCDDMLPLRGERGVAMGIAPRLRLPLPSGGPRLAAHVARHLAADDRYGYVLPPTLAAHGTAAPLGAVIVLDRQDDCPASMVRLPPADTLSHLLRRNFAREADASSILARLHGMMEAIPTFRLSYAGVDEAASLLVGYFADWGDLPDAPVAMHVSPPPSGIEAAGPGDRFVRAAGVSVREVDGVVFLASDTERAIVQLNAVGHAVWVLLDTPATAGELSAPLAEALAANPARVAADVALLLGDMAAAGFIVRA